jgi:hypothetical protein
MVMNEQVTSMIPHLKSGSSYLFDHTRKGPFVGVFKGTSPTKQGDPEDTIWLEVDAYTEEGSGQERLANAFIREEVSGRKQRPVYSSKRIRPSLLRSISTPSVQDQKEMGQRFEEVRAEATRRAQDRGEEPVFPTLSLPTKQALSQIRQGSLEQSMTKKLWHWPRKVN